MSGTTAGHRTAADAGVAATAATTPPGPGGPPRITIDAGPAVPAWLCSLVALLAGGLAVWLTATTPAGWVAGAVVLAGAVVFPRTVLPAVWLGAIGINVIVSPLPTGWWLTLGTAALVLTGHLALAAVRVTENLDRTAPVALAVLGSRWSVFWRAQLIAQGAGVLGWAVPAIANPWVSVLAIVGLALAAGLLLLPERARD